MRSAKPAELVLEKSGVHPLTFRQTDVQLPHAGSSVQVSAGELLLLMPQTGMNIIYGKKTTSDMWH